MLTISGCLEVFRVTTHGTLTTEVCCVVLPPLEGSISEGDSGTECGVSEAGLQEKPRGDPVQITRFPVTFGQVLEASL